MKHLIIPDYHAKPGRSNAPMKWVANLAVREKPDVIIQLGDFFDMESLSSYDKGKKSFEGRRYKKDLAAGHDALQKFNEGILKYNAKRLEKKLKQYRPHMIMLGGNHEERIERVVQMQPEFEDVISLDDLRREEFGWQVVPFLQPVEIDGIMYSHYFVSGVKGLPIGGENPAKALLMKRFKSCTAGHTHILDFAERTSADGQKIMGLIAGCFFQGNEDWAPKEVNEMWWKGVILKHEVRNGVYDPEFISIERLKKEYA